MSFPTVDETFGFAPAVLFVPRPPATGRSWSWSGTSTDGSATVDYSGEITGQGSDTVGGVTVDVAVIKSTLHLQGHGYDITIAETDHFAPSARAITETDQDGHGTISGVAFTSTTVEKLRSLTPA